ncbi:Hypothetical predicted protein [Mytilus galloprovincialis]|uniref:Endonuclease/exonuclease/phosphatase domain-containing protein n=1 Tax=Mytilus galloprovincialis TaxID=29158 RepID=A0A8B6GIC3_MYTGA|nr:Hypothetical predicted protein [Mytilus galloprovincialis]
MPPDKNVYYKKYDIDVFDVLQEQIEHFSNLGTVAVIGDLNGRVGREKDFIEGDSLNKQLIDNIQFVDYISDNCLRDRITEDVKAPNSFGRRILELCKSSGLRICNGRYGVDSGKITFQNKNGSSLIDYLLMSHDSIDYLIKQLSVKDFNTYSCHAPLNIEIRIKGFKIVNEKCTCSKFVYNTVRWDEGVKDDIMSDLLENSQKFDDLLLHLTEHENKIDECVDELNKLLITICEQYTRVEVKKVNKCGFCVDNNIASTKKPVFKLDKPWITENCKTLRRQYISALKVFNEKRTNENRIKFNIAKQKYKQTEMRLKRQYKNQQGNMLNRLRRNNPKKFFRKFKRTRNNNLNSITLEQFQVHFQKLVSGYTHNENENQKESIQNVFEELDAPFTENELSYGIRQLKRDKTPGFDSILNEYLITGKAALTQVLC